MVSVVTFPVMVFYCFFGVTGPVWTRGGSAPFRFLQSWFPCEGQIWAVCPHPPTLKALYQSLTLAEWSAGTSFWPSGLWFAFLVFLALLGTVCLGPSPLCQALASSDSTGQGADLFFQCLQAIILYNRHILNSGGFIFHPLPFGLLRSFQEILI